MGLLHLNPATNLRGNNIPSKVENQLPTAPKPFLLKAGKRYNARVLGHAIGFNPLPLVIVVAGVIVVLFVLLARRQM